MKRVAIVCFDAGGGHRAAAHALREAIRARSGWEVGILNADDVLAPVDPIHRVTGVRGGELYNWSLRRGWTLGSAQVISVMHGVIRLLHSQQVRLLRESWRAMRPDLVISVIPHFNRALYESLRAEAPGTPYITVVTDLADYPPHFWFEEQDQHFICGSEMAVRQGRALGSRADRIWRVSGMVLHPRFYEPMEADRGAERRKIGLDPNVPTGIVLFGGYGSQSMIEVARRIEAAGLRVQLVFLCGRNRALATRLRAMKFSYPVHVEDFTDRVMHYMWLGDFLIGKPGPGSVSEALAMGLPVIVDAGARTLAQERYNVEWIRENGVGIPVRRMKELPAAVAELLTPAVYASMRRRIQAQKNRAVFEIVDLIDRIFAEHAPACEELRHDCI
jgi:UDP-N-acetylglucosamine:LPS N-acetylglucosamine transferase